MQTDYTTAVTSAEFSGWPKWLKESATDIGSQSTGLPDRRTLSVYAERLIDQLSDARSGLDTREVQAILRRQIYPASLSPDGSAIEALISRLDQTSFSDLMERLTLQPFGWGFLAVLSTQPDFDAEVDDLLRAGGTEWGDGRGTDEVRVPCDPTLVSTVIRYIGLNIYEPDAVHRLITGSPAGAGCLLGILGGYCHLLEHGGNGV